MDIVLTESAAKKVYQLITEEGNNKLKLRVYIEGGGCSGFQYCFTFDEQQYEDDLIIEQIISSDNTSQTTKVGLIVDSMSKEYLAGAKIDYIENLQGSHFAVHNPNAKTTCGCGSSFSV